MELGHTCVDVTDPPKSVTSGDYATLQMIYVSQFDHNENETFYACADIKFVEASAFKTTIPCFNATEEDDGNTTNEWTYHHTSTATSSAASSTSTSSSSQNSADGSNNGSSSSGGSGLSKGGIAGAVVGSVVGACLIVAAALFLYRRNAQKNRVIRQQKFEQGLGKDSASTPSVGMNNLSK
jgi:cobalamin biosynthesis Mg chelatase CobN